MWPVFQVSWNGGWAIRSLAACRCGSCPNPRSAACKTTNSSTQSPRRRRSTGGTEPDLLDEITWWQTDDFWEYALYAAVAYIRATASQAGVSVRQACQDLAPCQGHPAP